MNIVKRRTVREPGSALTHFIGMMMAIMAGFPLLIKAAKEPNGVYLFSAVIYITSMILLYAASTLYHTFDISDSVNRILKKFDHMMISVLIAGTYTPICLLVLDKPLGYFLLLTIWSFAFIGIAIKAFWVTCPKWFSSILYIVMGWTCVLAFTQLLDALPPSAFGWLLAGGIIYTLGGIIYALKIPVFDRIHRHFGTHEVFLLLVMGGSVCHFIFMYVFVI